MADDCICPEYLEKQFPGGEKDENGKVIGPNGDPNKTGPIAAACCGEGSERHLMKCSITKFAVIEAYLTTYNTILNDPLNGLKPGIDYCPNTEDEDSACPPKSSRTGQMELVITAKKSGDFEQDKKNPGYVDIPRVGCDGKELHKKERPDYGIVDDPPSDIGSTPPGFPIIIPITWKQNAPTIKPKNSDQNVPLDQCPTGPYLVASQRIPIEKTCIPKHQGTATELIEKCRSIGMDVQLGSVVCHENTQLCNLENCLEFEGNEKKPDPNERPELPWKLDVNAYIRKSGNDDGWDCLNYSDSPAVHIGRKDGETVIHPGTKNQETVSAEIITINIVIGKTCQDTLPEGNELKKATLYKRKEVDCASINRVCSVVEYWSDKNTPPATPEGYEEYRTYTCDDIISKLRKDQQELEKECQEQNVLGYCCVTNDITKSKAVSVMTFKKCCIENSIPGLTASWLGAESDITEGAAIAACDPCVACCVGTENNNALCVYTFLDKVSGTWTYSKEIVSGDTTQIRSAACDAFVGGSSKIFIDKIAQGAEVSIADDANISYMVKFEGYKARKFDPPFTLKRGDSTVEVDINEYIKIYADKKFYTIESITPVESDAHILFNSKNGTLKQLKEITTNDMTNLSCTILCPSSSSSKGYRSGQDKCDELNGKVALIQTADNAELFFANDPCAALSIDCNSLPEPPENKPNPSDNPELPEPLPKTDDPKQPPDPPNPNNPPEQQPRRCTDLSFTYKGKTHSVAISFPLNIQDNIYGEDTDLNFNNIQELLSYINDNASEVIPDKILDLIGIDKDDTLGGGLNGEYSYTSGEEYNCGDTPDPDAPPLTPDPTEPVDPADPPEPTECACLSINSRPNQSVNLPIEFTQDGESYSLDSPQKLNEYLQKYASPPFSSDGKINNTFLPPQVQSALGIDSANDSALRFDFKMVPCDCNDNVPDNPSAPEPLNVDPPSPPRDKSSDCDDRKNIIEISNKKIIILQRENNQLQDALDDANLKKQKAIQAYESSCGGLADLLLTGNCARLRNNIANFWDGNGQPPFSGATPNTSLRNYRIKLSNNIEQINTLESDIQTAQNFIDENC